MTEQLGLFADRLIPEGLRYQRDFISPEEERALITRFEALPLAPFQFGAFEGKRRVASFGFRYDYTDRRLHTAAPLPDWIVPLAERVATFGALSRDAVRHVLFTEYETGVGSAGIATRRPSNMCSGFRWRRPANSAFASRRAAPGSASRWKLRRARSIS